MDRNKLLEVLPPFKNKALLISGDQSVQDIITEVLQAHKQFAKDYDSICESFDQGNIYDTCEKLFNFCKKNIHYKVETDQLQTTRSPAAIIALQNGDCKHYAAMIAGVLDGLCRLGENINWFYRFASYKENDKEPQHVFVVVRDKGGEIWIDPVLDEFDTREPYPAYFIDKKTMALHRLSGTTAIGIASINLNPRVTTTIGWDTAGKYNGSMGNQLGLDGYQSWTGTRDISNIADLTNRINQAIAAGPQPGHTVTPDFVKWIYDNSIFNWNFFYQGGILPGFDGSKILPPGWPRLVLTKDGRLTFDRDVKVDDYRNPEIFILTGWIQSMINEYDPATDLFPVKPADVKIFSQSYTGNPNNPNANLLSEHRGTGVVTEVLKAVNNTVNIVKDDVLKVVGAVPRNAFLALVRINMFSMATDLQRSIAAGRWNEIAAKWKDYEGDPTNLLNTINDAAAKQPVNDTNSTINSNDQISGMIGNPAIAAAVIAAAGPIIIAFMSFLSKNQQQRAAANGTVSQLNEANPGAGYAVGPDGVLRDKSGNPVSITGSGPTGILAWIEQNPIMAAAIGAGIYFLFFND